MQPKCPACGTELRQMDPRPGKETWVCPVSERARDRGILGQPGRKHSKVTVYERRTNDAAQ